MQSFTAFKNRKTKKKNKNLHPKNTETTKLVVNTHPSCQTRLRACMDAWVLGLGAYICQPSLEVSATRAGSFVQFGDQKESDLLNNSLIIQFIIILK
jgi:hypothetical protein